MATARNRTSLVFALIVLSVTSLAAHAAEETAAAQASFGAAAAGASGSAINSSAGVLPTADIGAPLALYVNPQVASSSGYDGYNDYDQSGTSYPSQSSRDAQGTAFAAPSVVDDAGSASIATGATGGQDNGAGSSLRTVIISVVGAVIVMTALFCGIAFCCCRELCGCIFGDTLSSGDYDLANLAEAGAAGAAFDHMAMAKY